VKDPEHWMELAALAAKEQDSEKLLCLVQEINRLLGEKQERLNTSEPKRKPE
jgi:hypothetical protein